MDQKLQPDTAYDLVNSLGPYHTHPTEKNKRPMQYEFQIQLSDVDDGNSMKPELKGNLTVEGKGDYSSVRKPLLDGLLREGLKKLDSFDRWMSKELGDVNESHVQPSSGTYWETVESEDGVGDSNISTQEHLESFMLGPSLSHDQLFSIIDFSPNWAYAGSEIKVRLKLRLKLLFFRNQCTIKLGF